jgi:hypothetical protein
MARAKQAQKVCVLTDLPATLDLDLARPQTVARMSQSDGLLAAAIVLVDHRFHTAITFFR